MAFQPYITLYVCLNFGLCQGYISIRRFFQENMRSFSAGTGVGVYVQNKYAHHLYKMSHRYPTLVFYFVFNLVALTKKPELI